MAKKRKLGKVITWVMIVLVVIVVAVNLDWSGVQTATPQNLNNADILTGVVCNGDNIQGVITNPGSSKVVVADLRVLLDGTVVDSETLRCDKTELAARESTTCESLQGLAPATGESTISVVIGTQQDSVTISC